MFPLVTLATACAAPGRPAPASPSVLPLRTLRLYETGVGYFEREGTLSRGEQAGLPVPAGHLDDALKTLVVLSAGGKSQVDGIEFGSSLSHGMARAMAGLSQDAETPLTYEALLASLEGSMVEVRSPSRVVVGRLVHVERLTEAATSSETGAAGKDTKESKDAARTADRGLKLTLLAAGSELVQMGSAEIGSVRPIDPAQASRLDAALESLLSRGGQSHHALRLLGEPGAKVTLGYIAETPVWRTTYRLVQPAEGPAKLQAWALLHNDTDENWNDVRVDLVNGRPDSFLFPLAAPRYARRTLVTPENELSTVPQLMGRTADTLWGDHVDDAGGSAGFGASGYGSAGGASGSGFGHGGIGSIGHFGASGADAGSSLLEVGDLAGVSQASGVEAGALFVYGMASAVALRAHCSALVPFLQEVVEAEPTTWIDEANLSTSRSAVRFVNSTSQTLPPGTIAFFSAGGFAGESALDRLKPKERRFVTFGVDLDVEAKREEVRRSESVQRLSFSGDWLREHFIKTTDAAWTIENRAAKPRTVTVALRLDRNSRLTGADAADFDEATSKPLIAFKVAARSKLERSVQSVEGLSRGVGFAQLTSKHLAELAAKSELAAGDRAVAAEGAVRAKSLEDGRGELARAREELVRLDKELARLRDDAKSVGDRGALTQPLVARIVTREDDVRLRGERIEALEKEVTQRAAALRESLGKLTPG